MFQVDLHIERKKCGLSYSVGPQGLTKDRTSYLGK